MEFSVSLKSNFFANLFKRSGTTDNLLTASSATLEKLFGVNHSAVSETTALKYAAYYRAVDLVSDTIATLPWQLYKSDANNNTSIARDAGELYNLIHSAPNSYFTSFSFRKLMMVWALMHGNSYARIFRAGNGRPKELMPIHPSKCQSIFFQDGVKFYSFQGFKEPIEADDIVHIMVLSLDGLSGISPITYHARNIGVGLSHLDQQSLYYKNGVSSPYYLTTPQALKEGRPKELSTEFTKVFGGVQNSHQPPVLHSGTELKSLGISQGDAQALEHANFNISDIARAFKLPLHKLGIHAATSHNSLESQNMEYVQDCLLPWITQWEQEIDSKLFIKTPYFNKLDLRGLLRGDTRTRWEAYRVAVTNGVMNPNEIRELEDMNARPGGDEFLTQQNMATGQQLELMLEKMQAEIENLKEQKSFVYNG